MTSGYRLVLLAFVASVAVGGCRCGRGKPPTAAQERIDELLTGGPPTMGPREPLDEIKRDFPRYRDVLRRELDLPDDLRRVDDRRAERLGGALIILGYVGTRDAGDVIVEGLREPLDYLKQAWKHPPTDGHLPPVEKTLTALLFHGLDVLGGIGHPGLVDETLTILASDPLPHSTARLNLLQYLAAIAPGDPTILERLERLLTDRSSPLFDDHDLRLIVEFLQKQKGASGASPDTP
jgi:hypothetical protein